MRPSPWLASLLAGAAAFAAPQAQASVHRIQGCQALGTSLDLVAVGGDRAAAQAALVAALDEIARLEPILSGWRQDSELSRLNRSASAQVSPDLYAVIEAAEAWRRRSGGAFDGRLGLVQAEGFGANAAARAARLTLDPQTRTITRDPYAVLALDGIAKGYVIDAALKAARRGAPTLEGLLIDIGGDLVVWGRGPGGDWRLGAADPARPEDNASPGSTLRLTGGAMATSGRGARNTIHLTREGLPASLASATAVAACALDADALSTALAAMQPAEGLALVEATPGAEARLVGNDGGIYTSSGWRRLATDAPPAKLIRAAAVAPASVGWPAGFQVSIDYQLLRPAKSPVYSPYLSIWITDAAGRMVRQLLLQGNDLNYIDQNYVWWRRYGRSAPRIVDAVTRPTRPAGRYSAVWDGKDQSGQFVGQGKYTIHIEAIREHGAHSYQAIALDLADQPVEGVGAAGEELGPSRVRYGRR